jgi:hypothetical protein
MVFDPSVSSKTTTKKVQVTGLAHQLVYWLYKFLTLILSGFCIVRFASNSLYENTRIWLSHWAILLDFSMGFSYGHVIVDALSRF